MKQTATRSMSRRQLLPYAAAATAAFAWLGLVMQSGWSSQQRSATPEEQRSQPASERPREAGEAHMGELLTVEDGTITMTVKGRNQHTHELASDARVTINGKPAALEDLRRGDVIRVSTENNAVVAIEARRRSASSIDADRPAREQAEPGRELAEPGREQAEPGREQAERGRRPRDADGDRAWLGVTLQESRGGGVLIADVFPNGPADRADIRPGDYLMSIDDQKVSSVQGASDAIAAIRPETEVTLTIFRDGNERRLGATLGARHEMRSLVEENPPVDDALDDDDFAETMRPACEECVQKLAEQHQRLEEQIRDLVAQVQALRSELAEFRGGAPGAATQPLRGPEPPQNAPEGGTQQPDDSGM